MYEQMGLTRPTAEAVAREVHADPELAVKVHITQELGVDPDDQPSPWTAAISSFVAFSVGGILPLISFLLGSSSLVLGLIDRRGRAVRRRARSRPGSPRARGGSPGCGS